MNWKYLKQTVDYTGTELYYVCSKDDTINGYIDDMKVSSCKNFEVKD